MVEDVNTLLRLLGPVELIGHDAVPVAVSAPKRRSALAALALELNRVVPVERLVDVLWDGEPPPRARTPCRVTCPRCARCCIRGCAW